MEMEKKNYKMQKFCELELCEYIDMYPQKKVQTFFGDTIEEVEKNARKYCTHMTQWYSGGPTRFIKVMNTAEAKKHIEDLIVYEKNHWQEDSQEFIDNITNLYKECYEQ